MKLNYPKHKVLLVCLLFFVFLIVYNNRSVQISSKDETFLKLFLKDWHLNLSPDEVHRNFTTELNFISTVQDSVVAEIRHKEIAHCCFGDMSFYYRNRTGFCYDRAVILEKIFSFYHFPIQHVFLYFGEDGREASLTDFFKKGTRSHAVLEVKTRNGWMTMGTNANWLGLTVHNELLTIGALRKKIREKDLVLKKNSTIGNEFWKGKGTHFKYVYGLYSRHGDFFNGHENLRSASLFGNYHFFPDYNLQMIFHNL